MRITWKDAAATVSTGGAVALERAYYHNYDWPLVSSMRWVIGGLAILSAITLIVGFAFDKFSSAGWDLAGMAFGLAILTLTVLGLYYTVTDYVALLMLSSVVVWITALGHHLAEHVPAQHTHVPIT